MNLSGASWKDRQGLGAPQKQKAAHLAPRLGLPSTGVPIAGQNSQLKATTPTVGPAAQFKWDTIIKWGAVLGGIWFLLQLNR